MDHYIVTLTANNKVVDLAVFDNREAAEKCFQEFAESRSMEWKHMPDSEKVNHTFNGIFKLPYGNIQLLFH